MFTVATLSSSRCVSSPLCLLKREREGVAFFHPVGQPLSAEWPYMLITGCFHRPPLRLMRLHRQLYGFSLQWVLLREEPANPQKLISPPSLCRTRKKPESTVWEEVDLPLKSGVCVCVCLLDWTHCGWVFVWMRLTAWRFKGPWPDGEERQEAGILCKVKRLSHVCHSHLICMFCTLIRFFVSRAVHGNQSLPHEWLQMVSFAFMLSLILSESTM